MATHQADLKENERVLHEMRDGWTPFSFWGAADKPLKSKRKSTASRSWGGRQSASSHETVGSPVVEPQEENVPPRANPVHTAFSLSAGGPRFRSQKVAEHGPSGTSGTTTALPARRHFSQTPPITGSTPRTASSPKPLRGSPGTQGSRYYQFISQKRNATPKNLAEDFDFDPEFNAKFEEYQQHIFDSQESLVAGARQRQAYHKYKQQQEQWGYPPADRERRTSQPPEGEHQRFTSYAPEGRPSTVADEGPFAARSREQFQESQRRAQSQKGSRRDGSGEQPTGSPARDGSDLKGSAGNSFAWNATGRSVVTEEARRRRDEALRRQQQEFKRAQRERLQEEEQRRASAAESAARALQRDEECWAAFEEGLKRGTIKEVTQVVVPYPNLEPLSASYMGTALGQFKKDLRKMQLRWHPDRFQSLCGAKLCPQDREPILKKVNQISQQVNSMSTSTVTQGYF
ncbi:hypothetical protein CYMTET_22139 [Cymbomonas tetramitiformis]|uniref:Uncharacterized protein n=1 Tax=Cymbomonas tetramitiformis TaxID=36881 RepID=A0AAE0L2A0_9CHLO|nr:hypothetical protein CYMTET_22139 [Cymbomonas tetramitiformis]|eukprot:gene23476-28424_t